MQECMKYTYIQKIDHNVQLLTRIYTHQSLWCILSFTSSGYFINKYGKKQRSDARLLRKFIEALWKNKYAIYKSIKVPWQRL